ncbi:MAG: DUF1570 domain-containing protein, partial [Planctomycetota bacterium]|nr:DUF1570 domain-containing protein [Planctomycetota bacterium]
EAKRKYSRGRVVEQDAEIKRVRNTVASKSSPVKVGRPFVLQVKVNRKTIKVSYNGRAFLSADKEDDAWGFAGLVESSSFSELIIEGQAEPSWLQGLVDAEDAKHRKSFERTYDRKKHLPEWLFERVERREDLVAPVMERWPGALTKEQRQFATAAEVMLAKGLLDAGLSNMKQLPESALPTPARTYLRAKFLAAQGRPEDAMRTLAGVRASHADFYYGHALQGELLLSVGKTAEAVAVYDRLLEDYSGGGDFHAEATVFFLQLGRVDRAQEIVKGAKARGVSSKTLDTVDNIVAKAMNGPGFARRFEHQSAHYIVISNLDKATCRKASRLLERAYAAYVRDLGKVADRDKRRFPVYLFRGRGGFGDYCKDLFGVVPSRNSAGLYHLTLKQLLIWNLPEREQMLQTVRHEGFHQYLDRVMRNVPRWFNEGLAEYYETAGYRDGKWQSGGLRGSHLKIVRKHRIPLRQFLFLGPRAFMARAQQNYAQAWAFVYFLRHTTPARAELFKKFWNAYKTIGSPSGATKRALEGHDLDELDRAFRRWVEVPG